MKRLEKITHLMIKAQKKRAGACPDAEQLAAYVDNLLGAEDASGVEEHLAGCDLCLDQVILCSGIKKKQKSADFRTRTADVVVSFLKSTVEVIRRAADITVLPPAAAAPVRGRRVLVPNAVKFSKDFGDVTVDVEVERHEGETGEILVRASKGNRHLDNVRVSLFSRGKELASYLTEDGHVVFEDIRFGKYIITFGRNNVNLGELSLKVKEG